MLVATKETDDAQRTMASVFSHALNSIKFSESSSLHSHINYFNEIVDLINEVKPNRYDPEQLLDIFILTFGEKPSKDIHFNLSLARVQKWDLTRLQKELGDMEVRNETKFMLPIGNNKKYLTRTGRRANNSNDIDSDSHSDSSESSQT